MFYSNHFHQISSQCHQTILGAIAVYATYMIALYLIYLPQSWHFDGYFIELSTCGLVLNEDGVPLIAQYFGIVSLVLELFLPSLITFTCFVVVTRFLMTWPVIGNEEDRKFHRASVTITIFTAVFLVCNTPCFLVQVWDGLAVVGILPGQFKTRTHRFNFYAGLLMQRFAIFLNSAINPLLYLLRMRGYQKWILQVLKSGGRLCKLSNVETDRQIGLEH